MSQRKLAVDECVEDGEQRWRMNSIRSSAMSDVFSPFHIFTDWLFASDLRSHYLRVLALTCPLVISPHPLQIFV